MSFQSVAFRCNRKSTSGSHMFRIPNAHNCYFIMFDHVWIEIHWNNIWLRAPSHRTPHYTWGSVTTLRDFGGVLGQSLDNFFWALTVSWSWLLARVWSGPESLTCKPGFNHSFEHNKCQLHCKTIPPILKNVVNWMGIVTLSRIVWTRHEHLTSFRSVAFRRINLKSTSCSHMFHVSVL